MRPSALEWTALGAAIAVRVAALLSFEQTAYANFPLVDAHTYWAQAQQIFSGEDPFSEGLYQPPGYPLLLAATGFLTGALQLSVVRWIQLLLGIASSVGLLVLGRRLGERAGAPWAGAASVLLFSLYPSTLLFEQDLLTPTVTSAALIGALLCMRRILLAPVGGVLAGVATVCHPTYLIATAWLALRHAMGSGGRRALAGFGLAVALCLTPTTIRNIQDFGTLKLVSHNAGLNLYLGNNPAWRKTAFLWAGLPFRQLVLEAEPHRRDVAARDAYWRARALDDITDHPDAWAAAMLTKSYWSIHNTEIPRNEDYRCRLEEAPLSWVGWLPVRYGWVFPFALLGAAGVIRRRDEAGLTVVGTWAALHVPLIVFFVADRYRLATWPMMCLLAPLGPQVLRELIRSRSPWLVAPVAAAVIPWLPTDPVTHKDPARCLHVQGNLAFMQEDTATAQELYERSLAEAPDNMSARTYLASIHYQARRYDEAAAQLEPVLQQFPDSFPSLKLMSSIQRRRGDISAAADYMGRAYRVPGERRSSGVRYVLLLIEAGRTDEARTVVRENAQLQRDRRVREALQNLE